MTLLAPAGWLEKSQNLYFTVSFICLDETLKNGLCWEVESVIPRIHVIFRQRPLDL